MQLIPYRSPSPNNLRHNLALEREIQELQKQRKLEEGRLATFGTSVSYDNKIYGDVPKDGMYCSLTRFGGCNKQSHLSSLQTTYRQLEALMRSQIMKIQCVNRRNQSEN